MPYDDRNTRPSSGTLTPTNGPDFHEAAEEQQKTKTEGSSSEEDEYEKRDRQVLELARSHSQSQAEHPFEFEKDSHLDPRSPNFKPRAWAKALIQLQAQDPEHYQNRTAGFAFRDLNVWGYGADTDYQKTVSNLIFQVVGLTKRLFGNKGRRIDILQHMVTPDSSLQPCYAHL